MTVRATWWSNASKETYIYIKRAYTCIKRDLHMYQKRPTHVSKETNKVITSDTHTYTHTITHKYTQISMLTPRKHLHPRIHIHIQINTYIYTCAYMHTYTYIYKQNSFNARLGTSDIQHTPHTYALKKVL